MTPNDVRRPSAEEVINKYNLFFKKYNEDVNYDVCFIPLANLKKFNP